jgi:hypothetical protein
MGEGDYLGEARGLTLPRGQLLAMIVRVVEEKAAEDDGYRKLADKLRAQLVDPNFDLDAPVDLADLMAIIAEHHEDEPPEHFELPRRDEFPGGPQ